MRRVLNVGGNNKSIALPAAYEGYEHVLLDIDPAVAPDILCDARHLDTLGAAQFDAVYCSHNLKHYLEHDLEHEVPQVLAGFRHVLKEGGVVHIGVPDLQHVMQAVAQRQLDVGDALTPEPSGRRRA